MTFESIKTEYKSKGKSICSKDMIKTEGKSICVSKDREVSKLAIKIAKTDGSGFDISGEASNPEELVITQVNIYNAMVQYSSGGGRRFQAMLDLNWSFIEDARRLASHSDVISTPAPLNSSDDDGGIRRGLAILEKMINDNESSSS